MTTDVADTAPARVLPTAVYPTTDLSRVDLLPDDELEAYVFTHRAGAAAQPGLRPGEHVARLADCSALVYGHVPADQAIRATATSLGDAASEQLVSHVAHPPTWAVFTRHRLSCATGGDPTACGCAPAGEPDARWAYGADRTTPTAVPVTPVTLVPSRA